MASASYNHRVRYKSGNKGGERATAAGMTVAEFEEDFFVNFRPTSLLKRFVSAEEVANLAVYLCSPIASATTGAALRVDGGAVNQIM